MLLHVLYVKILISGYYPFNIINLTIFLLWNMKLLSKFSIL